MTTTAQRPYGSIAAATKLANHARFNNPPRPRPRTAAEESAVETLNSTNCPPGSLTRKAHLIPATATVCLWCGTDATEMSHP